MRHKKGVVLKGVCSEMFIAAIKIEAVLLQYNQECVITSGREGTHSRNSRHYIGCALDFRNRNLAPSVQNDVIAACREAIGAEYFIQMESNHIHCQFNGAEGTW